MYKPAERFFPRLVTLTLMGVVLTEACALPPRDDDLVKRFTEERVAFERLLTLALSQPGNEISIDGAGDTETGELMKQLHIFHVYGDKEEILFSCSNLLSDSCFIKGYMLFITAHHE